MDNVIGLGGVGVQLASLFERYEQYDVYKIDANIVGQNCFSLGEHTSPEKYEQMTPDMSLFFKDIEGEILFICQSEADITGAALKILQQLKHCSINVLLISPNLKEVSGQAYTQHKIVYNVLQQYARSGIFNRIFLVDTAKIEDILGDVPFLEYQNRINNLITSVIHGINYFTNTKSIYGSIEKLKEISKIATFGIYDMANSEEKNFANLSILSDKIYYFAIDKNTLNTDGKLLKNIREHVTKNEAKGSYQIHSTEHSQSYCYYVAYTNVVQSLDS
jgi:hypothetical protein